MDDPVRPTKITVERQISEAEARRIVARVNAQLEDAQGKVKAAIEIGLNAVLPDLSLLYENKAYKILGYNSWGKCVEREFPILSNYGRSYVYLLGDVSIVHRDLLEAAPDNGFKYFVQSMPISQKTELLTLPDVGLQTAAVQMAVQFANSFGPETGVTASMISAAVQTVKQIALTGGKVDTGETMKNYEGTMHLEYNKIVEEAVEKNKGRLGVSDWEIKYLQARIVSFPQGASNYVILQLDPNDFEHISNMTAGSYLPIKVKVKKPTEKT